MHLILKVPVRPRLKTGWPTGLAVRQNDFVERLENYCLDLRFRIVGIRQAIGEGFAGVGLGGARRRRVRIAPHFLDPRNRGQEDARRVVVDDEHRRWSPCVTHTTTLLTLVALRKKRFNYSAKLVGLDK